MIDPNSFYLVDLTAEDYRALSDGDVPGVGLERACWHGDRLRDAALAARTDDSTVICRRGEILAMHCHGVDLEVTVGRAKRDGWPVSIEVGDHVRELRGQLFGKVLALSENLDLALVDWSGLGSAWCSVGLIGHRFL